MPRPMSEPSNDVTVYLVLNDYRTGVAYLETAADEADRETIIRNFISGEYSNPLKVVAFNTAEGWSWDVSEDIALLSRADRGSLSRGRFQGNRVAGRPIIRLQCHRRSRSADDADNGASLLSR